MYRTIDAALWTDPKIKKLSASARLLFVYLITNPHTHVSGIYYLPLTTMTNESGISPRTIRHIQEELAATRLCRFDAERELVWVCSMMKYQGHGEKARKSAAHHLVEDLHNSPLIKDFIDKYPDVRTELERMEADIVSIGYPAQDEVATPDSRSPIPDSRILTPDPERIAYGEFQNVRLTDDEHSKLKAKFNGSLEGLINRLDRYAEQSPAKFRKYKSHYATILNWAERDVSTTHNKQTARVSQLPSEAEILAAQERLNAAREPRNRR